MVWDPICHYFRADSWAPGQPGPGRYEGIWWYLRVSKSLQECQIISETIWDHPWLSKTIWPFKIIFPIVIQFSFSWCYIHLRWYSLTGCHRVSCINDCNRIVVQLEQCLKVCFSFSFSSISAKAAESGIPGETFWPDGWQVEATEEPEAKTRRYQALQASRSHDTCAIPTRDGHADYAVHADYAHIREYADAPADENLIHIIHI